MTSWSTRFRRHNRPSASTARRKGGGDMDQAPGGADQALGRSTIRTVFWHLMPLLLLAYLANNLDRINIGLAGVALRHDLNLTATMFATGAGLFFVGYFLFEVPSNLVLERIGGRRWIARIMVSWGILSAAMIFVRGPASFYGLRFLLGVAEAGFIPGILFYLVCWLPAAFGNYARHVGRDGTAGLAVDVPPGRPAGGDIGRGDLFSSAGPAGRCPMADAGTETMAASRACRRSQPAQALAPVRDFSRLL